MYMKRGLGSLRNMDPKDELVVEREKRFSLRTGETGTLVLVTPSLDDFIIGFEHSWFRPGFFDKAGSSLFCMCTAAESKDSRPQTCRICSEQMFCEFIRRKLRAFAWVVDCTPREVEGKKWVDTPKLWALTHQYGLLLEEQITAFNRGGRQCHGLVVKVQRVGDQAPQCGSHFDIQGFIPFDRFLHSPRIRFYQDKVFRDSGGKRRLAPKDVVREYFEKGPDLDSFLAATQAKQERFLAYVRRQLDRDESNRSEQKGSSAGWSSSENGYLQPEPRQFDQYARPEPTSSWGDPDSYREVTYPEPDDGGYVMPDQGKPPVQQPRQAPVMQKQDPSCRQQPPPQAQPRQQPAPRTPDMSGFVQPGSVLDSAVEEFGLVQTVGEAMPPKEEVKGSPIQGKKQDPEQPKKAETPKKPPKEVKDFSEEKKEKKVQAADFDQYSES